MANSSKKIRLYLESLGSHSLLDLKISKFCQALATDPQSQITNIAKTIYQILTDANLLHSQNIPTTIYHLEAVMLSEQSAEPSKRLKDLRVCLEQIIQYLGPDPSKGKIVSQMHTYLTKLDKINTNNATDTTNNSVVGYPKIDSGIQRDLNALGKQVGKDFDLSPDGTLGPQTQQALDWYRQSRRYQSYSPKQLQDAIAYEASELSETASPTNYPKATNPFDGSTDNS